MGIEIKGLDSLMAKLDRLGGDVMSALGKAVKQTVEVAKADAQANIHNRTGMLSQSIAHGSGVEYSADKIEGVVGTSAFYADYVERGTKNEFGGVRNPPYPYLMPALNANKSTFEYLAKSELKNAIKKAGG
jgi:HK97 gp10 family phage protein